MADEKINIIVSLKNTASGALDKLKLKLAQVGNKANESAKKAKDLQTKLEGIGKIGKTVAVGMGVVAGTLGLIGRSAIKAAGDWETMRTSFVTMLGTAEKADFLLNQIKKTAETTPFTLKGLADSSRTLLAFGIEAEKVVPTMRMLGDISGGSGDKLKGLTLAFAQMSSTGRLMGQDLLQMINQGFNPLRIISEKTGKSMGVLKDEMSKGAISAAMVTDAFKTATSEGGLFFRGMDRQSKTFAGRMSTLQDGVDGVMRSLGEKLLPVSKMVVNALIKLTEWFNGLSGATKTVIVVVGAIVFGISALATGFGVLLAVLPAVAAGITVLGITISAALWWITGIVAGITLLVAGVLALTAMMAPLADKTSRLTEEYKKQKEQAKSLSAQMKELEKQGKKNSSQYLKLQNELKKTNADMTKNEEKIRKNIKALADEKKAIEAKITAQKKDVKKASGDKKIKELEELEALESKKLAVMAASADAKKALVLQKDEEQNTELNEQQLAQQEEKAAFDAELLAIKDEEELAAFEEKLVKLSEQGELTTQQEMAIEAKRSALRTANWKKDFGAWLGIEKLKVINKQSTAQKMDTWETFMANSANSKNKSVAAIGKALAIKDIGFKTAQAAMSAYSAMAAIPYIGPVLGIAAAGAAVAYGAEQISNVNSGGTALAEGGVVMPTQGGTQATIGEAGSAEAVIPLDDPEAQQMMGGGDAQVNVYISGKPLAKEMYETQQEMIRTGELQS